jgi:type III secretory pathway component EscS
MQFSAKLVKHVLVLAVLALGAAWLGAQLAMRYSQDQFPQAKPGYALRIGEPPLPCPAC